MIYQNPFLKDVRKVAAFQMDKKYVQNSGQGGLKNENWPQHVDDDVHTCETIQSCWDGDRLDFERLGIKPHEDCLSDALEAWLQRLTAWAEGELTDKSADLLDHSLDTGN